jgi:PucR C-terminal helix-turn-helix domain/GGDEF-like domain
MSRAVPEVDTGAAAVLAERRRILASLLEDVEALADRGAAAIKAEIPSYRQADDRLFADMREQVVSNYRTKLQLLLDGRTATPEDLSFVRKAATRRARAGFALEDYVTAFRVGHQVFWDALLERAGESAVGHEAALELVGPVMRYVDFASTHAAHAYAEYQKYALLDAHRERRDLLEQVLGGDWPDRGPLLSTAREHGLAPDARMIVAVAVPSERATDSNTLRAATTALARSALTRTRSLVVVRQAEIVALSALGVDGDPLELCSRLETVHAELGRGGLPLSVGISTVANGIAELPRAYVEAHSALACIGGRAGVVALPRLSPFQYLALCADDTARRLIDPRVRAFLEEDRARGGTLSQTLQEFADCDLNVRVLAERLHVHPNTAHYRLARVQQRSGRCPRSISDLLELLLAIALDSDRQPAASEASRN